MTPSHSLREVCCGLFAHCSNGFHFLNAHTTKTDATHGSGFPGKVPLALRPKLMLPVQLKLVLSARFK